MIGKWKKEKRVPGDGWDYGMEMKRLAQDTSKWRGRAAVRKPASLAEQSE